MINFGAQRKKVKKITEKPKHPRVYFSARANSWEKTPKIDYCITSYNLTRQHV
jgi:hypothetical protein